MLHIPPPQNDQERWAVSYMQSIQNTLTGKRLIAISEARERGASMEHVEFCFAVNSPDEAWERAKRILGLTDQDAENAGPIICE